MSALRLVRDALVHAKQQCPYHGSDLERSGMWCGMPRCESCQQPWRVVQALAALKELSAPSYRPTHLDGWPKDGTLPPLVEVATGRMVSDPELEDAWAAFLREVG